MPSPQPALDAPEIPSSAPAPSSSNQFTFEYLGAQNPTASSYLSGFEIYYKFYDDSNGTAGTQYQTDNTLLSATATGPTQLVGLGYQRVYFYPSGYQQGTQITQPATPLIPIYDPSIKSTNFEVTIDFTGAFQPSTETNFYPQVDLNGTPIPIQVGSPTNMTIARYFAIPDSPFTSTGPYILEGFGNNDFANDQGTGNGATPAGDIPTSIIDQTSSTSTTSQALVLGLYAISYGLVNFTTPIYSTPTALGYIHYYAASFAIQSDP